MPRFKDQLRGWIPRPIWVLSRRGSTYLRRLGCWAMVLAEIRGNSAADAVKLGVSALAAPVTALANLDDWRNPELLFDTAVRSTGGDRFLCRRGSDDLWHVLPWGQGAVRTALAKHLKPGGVFVDAGANIGAFTVFGAGRVGPDGTVIAIEMMPDTVLHLRANLALNGMDRVRVIEAALSDSAGREVVARKPAALAGQASIVREADTDDDWVEQRVTTATLDGVLEGIGRIDVMKLDIEGAEALALRGGQAVLARTECVIFEDWGLSAEGPDVGALVAAAGLRVARLDGLNMIAVR